MNETMTREGPVRHLRVVTEIGVIHAPVKLQPDHDGRIRVGSYGSEEARFPSPMRRNGRLVFALPGGGEVLE